MTGSRPLAELLFRRGYTSAETARAFLSGAIDPDAPGLPDLEEGVDRLAAAIRGAMRICVYGDYDTDGVTATALLVDLLRGLGADVGFHVPNRFTEGYGMNAGVIRSLAAQEVGLILTCDCGIRNLQEVALARELGMQVVVTDHHELGPALPMADAVINPKRLAEGHPSRMLPGVGTAYLVARQLLRAFGREPAEADRWLDLVAVGVIADVVPLTGANRELARRGIARLNSGPSTGLGALIAAAGLQPPLTEEEIAFQLVPRLNAAGRLADAALGVRLLLTENPETARELAVQLDQLNQERKRLTATVVDGATAEAAVVAGGILLYRPDWHEGVLGIAAGRLAEQHGVPALLMARKQGGQMLVGSARAPGGFPLHEALEACAPHLVKHGGHAAAAGFSLLEERFPAFRAAMLEEIRRRASPGQELPPAAADLDLPMSSVDRILYDDLRRAAPYGEANPSPVIFSAGVRLLSSRAIGAGDRHLRLVLRDGQQALVALWWGAGPGPLPHERVDLFYRVSLNRWNGEEMLQLLVEELGPAEADQRVAPVLAPPAARLPLPALVDRRGAPRGAVLEEFPEALTFAEGEESAAVDRYAIRPASELLLLSPPPAPGLLEELIARSGASRMIMAWPRTSAPAEERFLPTLLRLLGESLPLSPYVEVPRLAVRTGELEATIRAALLVLEASDLLAIDEEAGERLRIRKREDGRGIREGADLIRMRSLLAESRAFRRFLRTAPAKAVARALHPR